MLFASLETVKKNAQSLGFAVIIQYFVKLKDAGESKDLATFELHQEKVLCRYYMRRLCSHTWDIQEEQRKSGLVMIPLLSKAEVE